MGILFWSIFILALGGCIGSFLNVVIYRWPLGLSLCKPVRSFCPGCRQRIAWYDNIPVISFLRLRGHCRHCGTRISLQYPIVELATALAFLMIYDAFFIARLRLGVEDLLTDYPILIAHWALVAGLIVLTVMDLEAYVVDIRVTWLIALAGIVGHVLWTPPRSHEWLRPGTMLAGLAVAAALGLGLGALLFLRRSTETEPDEPATDAVEDLPRLDASQPAPLAPDGLSPRPPSTEGGNDGADTPPVESTTPPQPVRDWRWLWLIIPVGLVAGYVAIMVAIGSLGDPQKIPMWFGEFQEYRIRFDIQGMWRLAAGLGLFFLAMTGAASEPREQADADIVEAIEFEAAQARRMALWELKLIAPAVVLGVGVLWLLTIRPATEQAFGELLHCRAMGSWQPIWGFSTGLAGWIVGGAIGWLARIGFTLLFGKEALGMGDVHILAAAGAVAGWPVALFGFFLGAILALLGLVVIRLRRQSRMLPYGPWLSLGFFLAVMFQDAIFEYLNCRRLFENG